MPLIPLDRIESAFERIRPHVRRTPFLRARHLMQPLREGTTLLKLENLQVSGSFKARGATNAAAGLLAGGEVRGVITASGGNHGAAVAYAGNRSRVPAVVFVPESTPAEKIERIASYGAEVIVEGAVWDDAQAAALERARCDGLAYIHPFADPDVMAGQGTVGMEMHTQSPDCKVFVIAIGGGGLISGIASALRPLVPGCRIIGVEPTGAPTLKRSLDAGQLVTLERIETRAGTLAPRQSQQVNLDIIAEAVEDIVLVSDQEMQDAASWLWREMGLAVELSAAAALAALRCGRVEAPAEQSVGVLVCGAGTDGILT